jgi:hypothetical protein
MDYIIERTRNEKPQHSRDIPKMEREGRSFPSLSIFGATLTFH